MLLLLKMWSVNDHSSDITWEPVGMQYQVLFQTFWIQICILKDAQVIHVQVEVWEMLHTTSDTALLLWVAFFCNYLCLFSPQDCEFPEVRLRVRVHAPFRSQSRLWQMICLLNPQGFSDLGVSPVAKRITEVRFFSNIILLYPHKNIIKQGLPWWLSG